VIFSLNRQLFVTSWKRMTLQQVELAFTLAKMFQGRSMSGYIPILSEEQIKQADVATHKYVMRFQI
jgi:hypothetical protein